MGSPAAPAELLLAEELLLLVLDDDKGRDNTLGVESGLAGALLLELAAGEWLDEADGKIVPLAGLPGRPVPTGLLADALAVIQASDKPRDAKGWVRKLPGELKPIKGRVAQGLVARGVLSEQRRKVLGLIPYSSYPEADPEPERLLRERLRGELTGDGDLSSRTVLLVPLLRAYDLVGKIVLKDERTAAKLRAKELAEDPVHVGGAVRSALMGMQVAVTAAVTTSVAAGAGSYGAGG